MFLFNNCPYAVSCLGVGFWRKLKIRVASRILTQFNSVSLISNIAEQYVLATCTPKKPTQTKFYDVVVYLPPVNMLMVI